MTTWSPCTTSLGREALIIQDTFISGSIQLLVDGTPQSHVNLEDPSNLFFEYIRRMGSAIDEVAIPGKPISALHLGGGAYTLPRYIEATRPGSSQNIVEIDDKLIDYVRQIAPLPKRSKIRVRRGDAREKLSSLPSGMHGNLDVIVVDVFSGSTTPAHLTTVQFYEKLLPFLHSESLVLVNTADGQGHAFVRRQMATLQLLFNKVAAASDAQTLKGKRFGNVVLIASEPKLLKQPNKNWQRILNRVAANGPHPSKVLQAEELKQFIAGSKPVFDENAVASPTPPDNLFK
ncbi:MAG TPA: fused MFS/spermidine synthase [Microbacteriaceae bacterium]|nr:fused MFS/spermidine synthase [Microbacteriaceae bacterium]